VWGVNMERERIAAKALDQPFDVPNSFLDETLQLLRGLKTSGATTLRGRGARSSILASEMQDSLGGFNDCKNARAHGAAPR
jgi:hypothetical protein